MKYETLKVFNSLDLPKEYQSMMIDRAETYSAVNGSYIPFWVTDEEGDLFSIFLKEKFLASPGEKVLIYWNW